MVIIKNNSMRHRPDFDNINDDNHDDNKNKENNNHNRIINWANVATWGSIGTIIASQSLTRDNKSLLDNFCSCFTL